MKVRVSRFAAMICSVCGLTNRRDSFPITFSKNAERVSIIMQSSINHWWNRTDNVLIGSHFEEPTPIHVQQSSIRRGALIRFSATLNLLLKRSESRTIEFSERARNQRKSKSRTMKQAGSRFAATICYTSSRLKVK